MKRSAGLLAFSAQPRFSDGLRGRPGSSHAAELTPHETKLAAQAREEGSVTMVDADQRPDHPGSRRAFVKRYDLGPNFKFNNLRKGTGATVAQTRRKSWPTSTRSTS